MQTQARIQEPEWRANKQQRRPRLQKCERGLAFGFNHETIELKYLNSTLPPRVWSIRVASGTETRFRVGVLWKCCLETRIRRGRRCREKNSNTNKKRTNHILATACQATVAVDKAYQSTSHGRLPNSPHSSPKPSPIFDSIIINHPTRAAITAHSCDRHLPIIITTPTPLTRNPNTDKPQCHHKSNKT